MSGFRAECVVLSLTEMEKTGWICFAESEMLFLNSKCGLPAGHVEVSYQQLISQLGTQERSGLETQS